MSQVLSYYITLGTLWVFLIIISSYYYYWHICITPLDNYPHPTPELPPSPPTLSLIYTMSVPTTLLLAIPPTDKYAATYTVSYFHTECVSQV